MKKIKKSLALFGASLGIVAALTGCSASLSGGSDVDDTSSGTNDLIAFVFSPAPNSGSSCILRDSAGDTISGPTATDGDGQVSFAFSDAIPDSWMSILCTGGSYTDQASQAPITLPSTTVLRNTFYFTEGTTTSLVLTPLTELAYRNIIGYVYQNYPAQLKQITAILGLGNEDVSDVRPTDVNETQAGTGVAGQYGLLMAVFSGMIKDEPASYPNLESLIDTLFDNVQGGALDSAVKADMLAALTNLTTNEFLQDNVPASMAGIGGTLYAALEAGNGGGALVATAYSGGSVLVDESSSTLIATATGGTPPYYFQLDSLINGSPPIGMAVDLNGYLTGTPTVAGSYTFSVCAVDLVADSSCKSTIVTVVEPSSPSSSDGDDYYYHWDCNGDQDCLDTNPDGTPTGSSNQGPGIAGEMSCDGLLTFAEHFWGDSAVSSCDQENM